MGYVTEESYVLHTKAGETRVTFLNEQGDPCAWTWDTRSLWPKEIPVVGFEGRLSTRRSFWR